MKFDLPGAGGDSTVGQVLAASPGLMDPNFTQTLVFMAEHNEKGAFGLVMNRPTGKSLGDVAKLPDISDELSRVQVYFGGPVRPEQLLVVLFFRGDSDSNIECRLDAPLEEAVAVLRSGDGWVRAFSGYAGWGEGQLEGELTQDAWKICLADPVLFEERYAAGLWSVFISGDSRWRHLLDHLPEDPGAN
jgi:putative transcriptional regulator